MNSGENPAPDISVEDYYEAIRHYADADFGGAWLEARHTGEPAPFPARWAPGTAHDTTWLLTFGALNLAALAGGNNAWLVQGLASEWYDNEGDVDPFAQADGDVGFFWWPEIDPNERFTYQTAAVHEVAIDDEGHIYAAAGDIGLIHMDGTLDLNPFDPEGAEIDCLWNGWHAGASSVSVGIDDSVWMALDDQSVTDANPYPHNIGILRTLNQGIDWEYAGAGWENATTLEMNVDLTFSGFDRLCVNDYLGHVATPFPDDGVSAREPAHAFSVEDRASAFRTRTEYPSFGNPYEIRAVDQNLAIALFNPTSANGGADTTDGGLYLTVDGGSTWLAVPFDGDADDDGIDDCDPTATYDAGYFELIHPGADSYWEGDLDTHVMTDFALDLILAVRLGNDAVYADPNDIDALCSLARVHITPPTGADDVDASWEWITLHRYTESEYATDAHACGVNGRSLWKLAVPAWSDEVVLWGNYLRDFNGDTMTNRYGGVCSMDLATHDTSMMVNPAQWELSIGQVAPHPDVADLYAILPVMSVGTWEQCNKRRDDLATDQVRCPDYPWPMVGWRNGSGAFSLSVLDTMPPTARPSHAVWSHLNVWDDSDDGHGSWLIMASAGSGAWRAEVGW